jgi:hypothetical protein
MASWPDIATLRILVGTEWCPECNGYGSSLFEETERCTRCGGSGLILGADPAGERPNGQDPGRTSRQD